MALLGVVSIAQVPKTVLAAPATHITRTPSRVPDIPIYGMGYNDRCAQLPAGAVAVACVGTGRGCRAPRGRVRARCVLVPGRARPLR